MTTTTTFDNTYVVTDDQESSSPLPLPAISSQHQQQTQQQRPIRSPRTQPASSRISQDSQNTNDHASAANAAITNWQVACHNREVRQRKEW
jgi:hypothetical protein